MKTYDIKDYYYVVFQNGNYTESSDFDFLKKIPGSLFFLKRILTNSSQSNTYGHFYYNYDFKIIDIDNNDFNPDINNFKLIEVKGFDNTASSPVLKPCLKFKLLDSNYNLREIWIEISLNMIDNIKHLFIVTEEIINSGGWEAFKVSTYRSIQYDSGDTLIIKS